MRDVFVQKIAESVFFRFRCFSRKKLIAGNFFKASMAWFGACISISMNFLISVKHYLQTPGANKREFFNKRETLPPDPWSQ